MSCNNVINVCLNATCLRCFVLYCILKFAKKFSSHLLQTKIVPKATSCIAVFHGKTSRNRITILLLLIGDSQMALEAKTAPISKFNKDTVSTRCTAFN